PLLAAAVAKARAGLCGRDQTNFTDIETAAALVFPQRATQLPDSQDDAEEAPPAPPADSTVENQPDTADADESSLPSGDMLIDAVRALLPADVLSGLVPAGTTRRASGAGAGRKRIGNRRGRPLPARAGALDGRNRIDLVATLRAAAPWQTIRKAGRPRGDGVQIRPSDIRVRRFAELSDRLLIFTVDASGSAAVSRLNEAKGAIELLLAQAYAARDHVALVAFRGTTAELLLPPTRSLVQTKRRLAALPGGGGTPLAAGLHDAATLATQARQRGMSPTVVLLTDGRANIALDGLPDRARAADDATQAARALRAAQVPALVIDAGNRPSRALRTLSEVLDGQYLPLPRADAHGLSGAVSAALDG
ncbi:MAG: VWA domain-containing protein, partial [Rhodobacteraceae bacterium]|nr:VWA domain-containing protein [Paracoccaceae bacterium]